MRRPWLDFLFRLDLRSLGAMRILYAVLLLHDWATRWPHLEAFYTSQGVWPIEAPLPQSGAPFHFSLLDPFTSLLGVRLVFLAGLVCYALFLVGWRTRIVHVLSFLFFASIRTRNPLLMHGGDTVLVTMLLWTLFLPLGARFSVDAARAALRNGVPLRRRIALPQTAELTPRSFAAFAAVLQLGLVYLATAAAKTGLTWRDGTAVYYTLKLDLFTTSFGRWLGEAPLPLLEGLTWSTQALEWAALPLMISPILQPHARRLAFLGLAGFHLGTFFTMSIGSFPFVMIASLVILLGPEDWSLLSRWADRGAKRIVAVYDDTCGFCQRSCQWLALWDRAARIRFVGASDTTHVPPGVTEEETRTSFIVTDEKGGEKRQRSRAVAALADALPAPYRVLRLVALPGIRLLADRIYDLVARNRYKLSERMGFERCGIEVVPDAGPPPKAALRSRVPALRWGLDLVAALLLASILVDSYNLTFAGRFGTPPLRTPTWSRVAILAFDLVQGWRMFAPDPFRGDGWWVMDAVGAGGVHADLFTGRTVDWSKPAHFARRYPLLWRTYLLNVSLPRYRAWRIYYARWLARRAALTGVPPPPLLSFGFWYQQEDSRPPGTPQPWPIQRFLLWGYDATKDAILPGIEAKPAP
jgi:predicted DCC family thiol-disulfide oxidoreductase YuxK